MLKFGSLAMGLGSLYVGATRLQVTGCCWGSLLACKHCWAGPAAVAGNSQGAGRTEQRGTWETAQQEAGGLCGAWLRAAAHGARLAPVRDREVS